MINPFNKLRVHRDDEDIEATEQVQNKSTPQNLFPTKEEKKPKKKRPEEPKQVQQPQQQQEPEDNDGFAVVGKQKKVKSYDEQPENIEDKGRKEPRPYKEKRGGGDQPFRGGNQRFFDRQSGTGRGKEVKKEGRGGKGTWEGKGRDIVDFGDTDYVFNKVLNSKQDYVRQEEETPYREKEVVKEEVVVETKDETKEEEPKVEEENKDGKDKKKKGKKDVNTEEEDEKNKLVIPENAMTLKDYKEKNAKITTQQNKNTEIKIDTDHLEPIQKDKDEHVLSAPTNKTVGKKGKAKNKEISAQEVEVNKILGANIKIEDPSARTYKKNYNKN